MAIFGVAMLYRFLGLQTETKATGFSKYLFPELAWSFPSGLAWKQLHPLKTNMTLEIYHVQ